MVERERFLRQKNHERAHPWVMFVKQQVEERSAIGASEISAKHIVYSFCIKRSRVYKDACLLPPSLKATGRRNTLAMFSCREDKERL
jgi:hypothetical protein